MSATCSYNSPILKLVFGLFSIIFIKDALPQSGTMGHKTEHFYRSLNQK